MKQIPYELLLGWRYTRAGRATRRNGFISFISGVSMLGIGLGVAALIIVLSVMNGFQKEVRDRMLGVISHIEVYEASGDALPDVERTLREARANPAVVGAAPFIAAQALLARGEDMKGVLVRYRSGARTRGQRLRQRPAGGGAGPVATRCFWHGAGGLSWRTIWACGSATR